jgi:hypothetical protein
VKLENLDKIKLSKMFEIVAPEIEKELKSLR